MANWRVVAGRYLSQNQFRSIEIAITNADANQNEVFNHLGSDPVLDVAVICLGDLRAF